jgi:hypothetical protein
MSCAARVRCWSLDSAFEGLWRSEGARETNGCGLLKMPNDNFEEEVRDSASTYWHPLSKTG